METIETPLVQETLYPSLVKRYKSYFIDILLIIASMMVLSEVLPSNTSDSLRIALFLFVWLVYEPLFTTLGCTLGNYLMGIRIRKYSDTAKTINIFQAYLRFILKYTLGYISFFTVQANRERRAIHDLASGSVVIDIAKS